MVVARDRLDAGLGVPHRRAHGPADPDRSGELGLPTGSVEEHHQPAGDELRDIGAEVVLHQGQGQVDARRDPGARPDGAVANVDRVGIHHHRGVVAGELRCPGPVRGDPPTVEDPGFGGQERPGAHGGHPSGARGGTAHPVDEPRVVSGGLDPTTTGKEQGVDPGPGHGQRPGSEGEPALRGDRARVGGDEPDVVTTVDAQRRGSPTRPGEHLEGPRDVERLQPGVPHDHQGPVGHVPHRARVVGWRQ